MDKEKEKLSKEIFLICKGRYNYEKMDQYLMQ